MRVELREFDTLERAEKYLTNCLRNNVIDDYKVIPYQIEPNVISYMVSCSIVE